MVGSETQPPPQRVQLPKDELERLSKEELIAKWKEQESYVEYLESQAGSSAASNQELVSLRESEEKLKQQQLEATRRENVLVMRLTTKEQEMQECAHQIQALKGGGSAGWTQQLRAAMLDPAVNLLFERMRHEVDSMRSRLEETQNELSAWKFTPDSNTGKRLMAKCRLLYQENEELGKMISSGRMAKLEGDLALQRNFSEEMKKSQTEQDEFLLELDEEVEGMQSTIYLLQQQLREAKEARIQAERRLATERGDEPVLNGHVAGPTASAPPAAAPPPARGGKRTASRATRAAPRRSAAPRTRKRAREQGADGPDAKVSSALEIDADTEVQVAQTLAYLFVANKERHQDGSSDSAAADDAQDL
ncbi:pre-mRNA-splicing regulator WTAP isoform X1 [Dermacentor silvarum]|uniref:pre-mRNA-splicing regulator WTAP isoform X1 n=1 Tax=Dermacentor silvarum TaxID=543639 RepID=UPI002100FC91|nr:pre-mRNA-splicing regulator WTAP isoform X1 [Dermacentor silvarum]XP_037579141.2 pre-mRNA-splicing regulator WTAP isoform X1 [Dermacentor silvarum]XP_037579142.2 pre-mRNA-splicing regulator WTAP isoform X1 [Dermacentor silvarum]XP_049528707.1 pre-mRNA-splicing regulator WTAP isoform X2 [Dermacentor silvarum]XP_049528708.1 pre-mRNA-splicing regulator WTAP isoform X1 [Dermacentor silvarum]XP_049528709.1 pre-mRNA-splicing regulator WTAP isoform X1 [Dermacentor silvarum]